MSAESPKTADGKRFNDELLVPRYSRTETGGSRAAPLFQPFEDQLELGLRLGVVGVELVGHDVILDLVFPSFFTVVEEPLVAESDDTLLTGTCDDLLLRLVVRNSGTIIDHLLSDDWLGKLDLLTSADS